MSTVSSQEQGERPDVGLRCGWGRGQWLFRDHEGDEKPPGDVQGAKKIRRYLTTITLPALRKISCEGNSDKPQGL